MNNEILKGLILSLVLGGMMGIQRQVSRASKDEVAANGGRTYALIALAGYLSSWLNSMVPNFLFIAGFLFSGLTLTHFFLQLKKHDRSSYTSEVASFLTFLFGVMVQFNLEQYAVAISVVTLFILEYKKQLITIEKKITSRDIQSAILFAMLTFVILPVVPNRTIDPYGIFNPYKTWLMVVLIAGISFVGYVAMKSFGEKKGAYLTGMFGGLISSTAVTLSFARRAKMIPRYTNYLVGGIAISYSLMFIRVVVEAFFFNASLGQKLLIPFSAGTIAGLGFVYWLHHTQKHKEIDSEKIEENPLGLTEALKLGLLFGFIYGFIAFFHDKFGVRGIYFVSFLSGLTDVDAITLSLSDLAKTKISEHTAMVGIVIAVLTNSVVKWGMSLFVGNKKMAKLLGAYFVISFSVMIFSYFLTR